MLQLCHCHGQCIAGCTVFGSIPDDLHAGTAEGGMNMLMGGGDGVHLTRSCVSVSGFCCHCCCCCCLSCCTADMGSTSVASMQWIEGASVLAFCVDQASFAAVMKLTVRQSMG
jgi:hypothetical protein